MTEHGASLAPTIVSLRYRAVLFDRCDSILSRGSLAPANTEAILRQARHGYTLALPVRIGLVEWVEAQGRNTFMEISVPDAAPRVVQSAGRPVRIETDTGRVTLMDRRILTRRSGQAILDSLPPFRRNLW